MKTPLNLQLDIDLVLKLREYAAERKLPITRIVQEALCQFLYLHGMMDEELRRRVEERIGRRAGRPRLDVPAQVDTTPKAPMTDDANEGPPTVSAPKPICARCSEVVEKCRCPEGPEVI